MAATAASGVSSHGSGFIGTTLAVRERHLTIRSKHRLSGAANAGRQTQKSENLLDRSFAAQRPNGKFLSDITEIGCRGGQFCLAAVLDCFDGTGDSTWMAT